MLLLCSPVYGALEIKLGMHTEQILELVVNFDPQLVTVR